jgi:hypothetical protein
MANTGAGESERRKEKQSMAEQLKPSRTDEKPSTKQTKPPTTPVEAAKLLKSALWYCQDAGLVVEGYNEDGRLILEIEGLAYADEEIIVTPAGVPTGVTGVTGVTIGVPTGVTSEQ